MDLNKVKEKIFPATSNYEELKYDREGLWSISHPTDADMITDFILSELNISNPKILDATAGLGGNTFSFSNKFFSVDAIEINKDRFDMLENNIKCYNLENINAINGNCLDYLSQKYDVYFFDPPWGGPKYKELSSLELKIGDKTLSEITKEILNINSKSLVTLKVPYNYNMESFSNFNTKVKKIRNMLIILLTKKD